MPWTGCQTVTSRPRRPEVGRWGGSCLRGGKLRVGPEQATAPRAAGVKVMTHYFLVQSAHGATAVRPPNPAGNLDIRFRGGSRP